jgi:thioredoxin-like negative regulator of GroEL
MLSLKPDNFSGTKLLDSRDILAVFYASWCPFSRRFLAIFESAMTEKNGPQGALVDISDEDSPLWETFRVDIVPTLVGFRDGAAIVRKDGVAGVGLGMPELEDALRKMKRL